MERVNRCFAATFNQIHRVYLITNLITTEYSQYSLQFNLKIWKYNLENLIPSIYGFG